MFKDSVLKTKQNEFYQECSCILITCTSHTYVFYVPSEEQVN